MAISQRTEGSAPAARRSRLSQASISPGTSPGARPSPLQSKRGAAPGRWSSARCAQYTSWFVSSATKCTAPTFHDRYALVLLTADGPSTRGAAEKRLKNGRRFPANE